MENISITHRSGGNHPDGRYVVNINDSNNLRMAVYGDSFGDGGMYKDTEGVANIGDWWPTRLAIRLQLHGIDNFCAGGTPFVFAYNAFINNYKNYDINVVLVTDPYRYTQKILLPTVNPKPSYLASSIKQLDYIKENYDLTTAEAKTVNELITWHIVKDDNFLAHAQQLMVDDILKRAPKTIIVPCFKQSAPFINAGLNDLVDYQWNTFGITTPNEREQYTEKPDVIGCHFTPEMNKVVSDIIFNRLITGEWDWNFPKIKHPHPIEYYYDKKTK